MLTRLSRRISKTNHRQVRLYVNDEAVLIEEGLSANTTQLNWQCIKLTLAEFSKISDCVAMKLGGTEEFQKEADLQREIKHVRDALWDVLATPGLDFDAHNLHVKRAAAQIEAIRAKR